MTHDEVSSTHDQAGADHHNPPGAAMPVTHLRGSPAADANASPHLWLKTCNQVAASHIFPASGGFYPKANGARCAPGNDSFQTAHVSVILEFRGSWRPSRVARGKKRRKRERPLDNDFGLGDTETEMQLSINSAQPETFPASLVDLHRGDAAILDRIDLPGEDARRLMELGFLPGATVTVGRSAPGGDPQVFQVDGSEIALRRETARRLKVHRAPRRDAKKT